MNNSSNNNATTNNFGVGLAPPATTATAAASAAMSATGRVSSSTAAVASSAAAAAAASARPHGLKESLYEELLRYHQEHDSASTGSSQQRRQDQQQHSARGDRPPHLQRNFSCTGDDDDRKVPALPSPELYSRKKNMVDPTSQRDVTAISPLTAPSVFLSISEDGNDMPPPIEKTTTSPMKKRPPPQAQQNHSHSHDDTIAAMHSSFYQAALEEANSREDDEIFTPPGGAHSSKNDHTGAAAHGDAGRGRAQQPRTVVVSSAADHPPPPQRDEELFKPYSPRAKKPGIVMVNEPAIRSSSPMYQAAYGNEDGRDSADRTRQSKSRINAAGGRASGSSSRRSTASTDSMLEDAAEAASATMIGSQPPSRNVSIDRSVVINSAQDQQPVPSPWPLTSETSSGSYDYNERQDQPKIRNFPPFPKSRGEYQPPKRLHSQPNNPTASLPKEKNPSSHGGVNLESRNSYTPGMNTKHSGMGTQNDGYVTDTPGYDEYTTTLTDDIQKNDRRSGPGRSFTSKVPSKPPPPSSIGGAVRHNHHHQHPRNPSPMRNPPTPSPMVPKPTSHANAIRRMSSGSSSPSPDLMQIGSDEHIRSSSERKSSHRQNSGGDSRRSSTSRSSSPARGVVSSTIASPQNKGYIRSTASSIPKNTGSLNTIPLRNPSPQASPTTQQRQFPTHLSSSAVTTSLVASAPWNDPSPPKYVSTSQRNLQQVTIEGRAQDGHFNPTKHVIERPIVRNTSNPDFTPNSRARMQQPEMRRSTSSSLGSLSLSGETSRDSKGETQQSGDSASTDIDPDLKLALELSLKEAAAASSIPESRNSAWNATQTTLLYPNTKLPAEDPDHHVPPSLSSRYHAGTHNTGNLDAGGLLSHPDDTFSQYVSTTISRQNAPSAQRPSPQNHLPHSRTSRARSPLPPHSHVRRPLNDDGRVAVSSGTSSEFGQDVYRPTEVTSNTDLDEDLMLALKLSAEEAVSHQHRSEGTVIGIDSSPAGAASSTPDEQYKILKRIQEEQERKQLEEALKASKEDVNVVPRGMVRIGKEREHGRPLPSNRIESTGGSGTLTPHPVDDQRNIDFMMSQRLAMEELQQQQQQQQRQPPTGGQVSTGQMSSSSGFPGDPKRDHLIERGTRETHAAIAAGQAQYVTCQGCGGRLHAPVSYSLVFCPRCSTITPY